MKKLLVLSSVLLFLGFTSPQQTWVGEISDSACKFEHESVAEGQPPLPSPECVKACLRGGNKYILVVEDKIYEIANQKHEDLPTFAGKAVKVTGELKDKAITISRIEAEPGR
jgi:hypothetical protein